MCLILSSEHLNSKSASRNSVPYRSTMFQSPVVVFLSFRGAAHSTTPTHTPSRSQPAPTKDGAIHRHLLQYRHTELSQVFLWDEFIPQCTRHPPPPNSLFMTAWVLRLVRFCINTEPQNHKMTQNSALYCCVSQQRTHNWSSFSGPCLFPKATASRSSTVWAT